MRRVTVNIKYFFDLCCVLAVGKDIEVDLPLTDPSFLCRTDLLPGQFEDGAKIFLLLLDILVHPNINGLLQWQNIFSIRIVTFTHFHPWQSCTRRFYGCT